MSDDTGGVIHSVSEGGVAGAHPEAKPIQLLVAPSTSDEFNTARLRLIPVACWRVDHIRFAFDSSFVSADVFSDPTHPKKDIRAELRQLLKLLKAHPGSPLSVFGHADPVGSDDYNKELSGRRAEVIYALLISNTSPDKAVGLWRKVAAQEHWGAKQRQMMQTATGLPAGTPDAKLFQTYMQTLCPKELNLSPENFLGQGADAGGKGDYQGCSSFNPKVVLSQEEERKFETEAGGADARNAANAPNRRVTVLLFRAGSKIDPTKWPCPRATEGVSGCRKRFWSNGDKRRKTQLPDEERKYEDTEDTFACRFYDRAANLSPCERLTAQSVFRYGVYIGPCGWPEDARIRLASSDGKYERVFKVPDCILAGNFRVLEVFDVQPQTLYNCDITFGDVCVHLFQNADIQRYLDPRDPYAVLPPPDVLKEGPDEE